MKKQSKSRFAVKSMTEGKPMRLILLFALPLMLGNIFQQMYTVVDTAIVGQLLGVEALASVGASDWLSWFMYGVVGGVAQGFAIPMSHYFGAKNYQRLNRVVGISLVVSAVTAVVLLVGCQLSAVPVLGLLDTPAAAMQGATTYLRFIFGGIPIIMAYNLLAAVLRALGDSKTPLVAMVVASLVNIGLDFVLVPFFGIAGAAGATVFSQLVAAVFCFVALKRVGGITISRETFGISWSEVGSLLGYGAPLALQNGIIAVGGMVVQKVVNREGMLFVAGFTATNKLYGLLEIAAISFGYAVTTYVGQNMGAKQVERIRKGMKASAVLAIVTSLCISAIMFCFGRTLLGLFLSGKPEQVLVSGEVAWRYLKIMSSCLVVLYLLYIYRSGLQGLGNAVIPMASGIVEFVMRVGAALLLPRFIGGDGIFYAEISAWSGAALLLVIAYYVCERRLRQRQL